MYPLEIEQNIEAVVKFFNGIIKLAGCNVTAEHTDICNTLDYHILVKHVSVGYLQQILLN
jgi:hypothetical protein